MVVVSFQRKIFRHQKKTIHIVSERNFYSMHHGPQCCTNYSTVPNAFRNIDNYRHIRFENGKILRLKVRRKGEREMEKYKILSLNGRKGKKGRKGGERIEGRFQGKKGREREVSSSSPPKGSHQSGKGGEISLPPPLLSLFPGPACLIGNRLRKKERRKRRRRELSRRRWVGENKKKDRKNGNTPTHSKNPFCASLVYDSVKCSIF